MGSNDYKYYQMTDFSGGINTQSQVAKKNQVLDANNLWMPKSELVVRPGVGARQILDPNSMASTRPNNIFQTTSSTATLFAVFEGGGAIPITPTGSLYAVGGQNSFYLIYQNTNPTNFGNIWYKLPLTAGTVNTATASANYNIEVLTSRGMQVLEFRGTPGLLVSVPGTVEFSTPTDLTISAAEINAAFPAFLLPINSSTWSVFRFKLTGVGAAGLSGGTTIDMTPPNNLLVGINSLSFAPTDGIAPIFSCNSYFKAEYAAGTKIIGVATGNISFSKNSSTQAITGIAPPFAEYSYRDTLFFNDTVLSDGPAFPRPDPTKTLAGNFTYSYVDQFNASPPSFTVVPEFNIAYTAYQNQVVQHPFAVPYFEPTIYGPAWGILTTNPYKDIGGVTTNPTGGPQGGRSPYLQANYAQVNTNTTALLPTTDPNYTPTGSPYPSDILQTLPSFPPANYIIYFKGLLWAAGLPGLPNFIRWSLPAAQGVYNSWPVDSQTYLSTALDNSEITGLSAMGDNLVVFKKNSIWQMVDNGVSDIGLNLFEARLVVAGVGCVAHGTIKQVNGGLVFLGEDGFYFYDGTPNIQRISDPLRDYIERISPARQPFAQGIFWRTQKMYFCAVSLDGEMYSNNYVFAYDLQRQAWWVFSGWDVQCWYQDDGIGLKEEIWFFDRYGRAYKLGWGDTDNGTTIATSVLTQRFGEGECMTKTALEVRLRGQNDNPTVTFDVVADDIAVVAVNEPMTMPFVGEALWSQNPLNGVANVPPRRRERKHPVQVTFKWVQVRIKNALKIIGIDLGYLPEGRR